MDGPARLLSSDLDMKSLCTVMLSTLPVRYSTSAAEPVAPLSNSTHQLLAASSSRTIFRTTSAVSTFPFFPSWAFSASFIKV